MRFYTNKINPKICTNVLIVDDNDIMLETLSEFVYSKNLIPHTAENVDEALEILISRNIDFIVTDLHMPGTPINAILDYLKENKLLHVIPVMLITATNSYTDLVIDYIKEGVTDVIFKPIDLNLLDRKFDNIIQRRSEMDEAFIEKCQKILKDVINLTSHEINNPLTITYANLEYLQSAIQNDYHNKEVVIERLEQLVKNVEDIEKKVSKMTDIDLETILSLDLENNVLGIDEAKKKLASNQDFFVWQKQYELGFDTIDKHHKKLVSYINQIHEAFTAGDPVQEVKKIFEELLKYTEYHFEFEEKIFHKIGYNQADEHIKKHHSFEKKIRDFMTDYEKNYDNPKFEQVVTLFLKDWLLTHILVEDRKYTSAFIEFGMDHY